MVVVVYALVVLFSAVSLSGALALSLSGVFQYFVFSFHPSPGSVLPLIPLVSEHSFVL